MAKKAPLQLVPGLAPTPPQPPRSLGKHGRSLWDRVMSEYDIRDAGGRELLAQACQALDRAEALRERIDAEGELIQTRGGLREHPGLKPELACRAFICRTLVRLGLDVEPVRPTAGRPGGFAGWSPNS